jgi:hypothetical protein
MCRRINRFVPLLFLGYLIGSIIVGFAFGMIAQPLPVWLTYFLSEGLLLLPAVIYVLVFRINIVKCMPYRKLNIGNCILSLLIGYALIPLVLFISSLTMLFSQNYINDSVEGLTAYPYLIQLLIIAVLPAVVEEFVFRGLLYHSYRKNGILPAALLSGLLFGLMHFNINQCCYAFVMGVVFALMVEVTGSMLSSMLAHFALNSYSITVVKLLSLVYGSDAAISSQTASMEDYTTTMMIAEFVFLGVLAVGFLAIALLLFKKLAERCGRWEYIKQQLKKGLKPQNGEKFLTAPVIITIVLVVIYMVLAEFILI